MPVAFNWRSPTESDYLKHLDRPGFAWEFLRRNPGYQEEYETIVRGAASDAGSGGLTSEALAWRWGLAFPRSIQDFPRTKRPCFGDRRCYLPSSCSSPPRSAFLTPGLLRLRSSEAMLPSGLGRMHKT